ncbi:MAG TPA: winged helix-turn-helix domain-containing protein [Nitrososphaeraceae archaeon]|nr:winged helix-turn-helix domain-containing protein [Nitrososphaeraceae archaeon]
MQRDRVYLIIDILTKLIEYGEINQSSLLLYCRLNLTKHKEILDELERNNFIIKKHTNEGKRFIISYSITSEGIEFYKKILEPYETFFPRK